MSDQLPELRVRPADAYAALRVIADGARAAADVIRDEVMAPTAEAVGATTFTTPFGKVYTSTTEAKVEILTSAALRAWLKANLPYRPLERRREESLSIIPEHQEDTFDEHQLARAAKVLREKGDYGTPRSEVLARDILRAAFPPRTVPEKIAEWVIPYLTQRAKIETEQVVERGQAKPVEERLVVVDSETGEIWRWATAVPKKVEWRARLSDKSKANAAGLVLDQVSTFATLVGVKEIGQ